jgi:5-methylthioadenosine/S-adenosylhomocysteine deaminase
VTGIGGSATVHARVLIAEPGQPPRRDAVLEFRDGRVAAVREATRGDQGLVYDVALPGLIDAHSHGRAAPLSAYGIGSGPLERFLIEVRELTPLSADDEALAAADAALATGITSTQVFFHDFGDAAVYAKRARAVAAGYATAGIRVFVALGLTDQDEYMPPGVGKYLNEHDKRVLTPGRGVSADGFPALAGSLLSEYGLASIDGVGPVAPQWCSDQALRAIASLPGARRVHAHLLESAWQRLAPDPVARLERAGLLRSASSFAHGVWLDDGEMERLAQAGATIVHCPGSNARLGTGTCRVRRLLGAGVAVALGLDSNGAAAVPDMFAEMRAALKAAAESEAPLTPAEVLAMATTAGARALGRADLGALRPGAAADAVALNLPGVTEAADPMGHVIEAAERKSIAAVWVAGNQARHSPQAGAARARISAALQRDAAAREARLDSARKVWQTAERARQAAEQRGLTTALAGRAR